MHTRTCLKTFLYNGCERYFHVFATFSTFLTFINLILSSFKLCGYQ